MFFSKLLSPEIQDFISINLETNITKLALQKNPFHEINWIDLLHQIASKTKAKEKLPTWFSCQNIIYPSKISLEQTSSEITAQYKSELVNGNYLIDLTGGFGVDDFYFSKKVKTVYHCEQNESLSQIAYHNFKQLKINNIICMQGNSLTVLTNLNINFDWIYIDPSRRNSMQSKVFFIV